MRARCDGVDSGRIEWPGPAIGNLPDDHLNIECHLVFADVALRAPLNSRLDDCLRFAQTAAVGRGPGLYMFCFPEIDSGEWDTLQRIGMALRSKNRCPAGRTGAGRVTDNTVPSS